MLAGMRSGNASFLQNCTTQGFVSVAAIRVGRSPERAYRLRATGGAESFALAWDHVLTDTNRSYHPHSRNRIKTERRIKPEWRIKTEWASKPKGAPSPNGETLHPSNCVGASRLGSGARLFIKEKYKALPANPMMPRFCDCLPG